LKDAVDDRELDCEGLACTVVGVDERTPLGSVDEGAEPGKARAERMPLVVGVE
jgi:hypothetical protein